MSNSKTLLFEVPDYLEEDEIEQYFRDNVDELMPAFDLELDDDRAQVDEVSIENLELSKDRVDIEYLVEYSAYYGCRDMNYADEDQRVVSGIRDGRRFEFEIFVPPPRRSTYEEF